MEPATGGLHRPIFLGLGSNLGDRLGYLSDAVHRIASHPACTAVRVAPVYESPAKTLDPGEAQPPYLNTVLWLASYLDPHPLMALCRSVEADLGRERGGKGRWLPRTLDIDLLAYEARSFQTPTLFVPHPRLAERRFVLEPWADLAPAWRVPDPFNRTVVELLEACSDTDPVVRIPETLDPAIVP